MDLFSSTPYLSCKAATQVHGTGASLGCLEPQHDSRGEFIVSSTAAGLLLLAQHTQQAMSQQFKLKLFTISDSYMSLMLISHKKIMHRSCLLFYLSEFLIPAGLHTSLLALLYKINLKKALATLYKIILFLSEGL